LLDEQINTLKRWAAFARFLDNGRTGRPNAAAERPCGISSAPE
jgi:hypothetical protein